MSEDRLDAALDGLNNWYEKALQSGGGFKSDKERADYVASLGDPMKHPMFATSTEDLEGNPLTEALRAIREEDKTRVELVHMYKDEGNEWMKKKDAKSLKEAYDRYSYAITLVDKAQLARDVGEEDDKDREVDLYNLRSILYSNRAAASMTLKNYGSCRKDAETAIGYNEKNIKAHYRRCKALFSLHEYEQCVSACNDALRIESTNQDILKLQHEAQSQLDKKRDSMLLSLEKSWNEKKPSWTESWKIAKSLNVSLGYHSLSSPEPVQLRDAWPTKVTELQEVNIQWPMLLLYPQYNQFDIIPQADVNTLLVEYLAMVFPELEENEATSITWDTKKEYQISNIVAYLRIDNTAVPINTFEEWLFNCLEHYILFNGGSIDVVRHGLKRLNNEQDIHRIYGDLNILTVEKIQSIAKDREEKHNNKLKEGSSSNSKANNSDPGYYEVHLGCTIKKLLTLLPGVKNTLSRGILPLIVFPKDNESHQRFLQSCASDHITIEILEP